VRDSLEAFTGIGMLSKIIRDLRMKSKTRIHAENLEMQIIMVIKVMCQLIPVNKIERIVPITRWTTQLVI